MDREQVHRKATSRGTVRRLLRDTRGATAIEYGLILSLVVIVMFVALAEVGSTTSGIWNNVSTKVTNAR